MILGCWIQLSGAEQMGKKTKRKVAYSKLPMQRQLNLQHEGKHFDLRQIFDDLNERYFRGDRKSVV